MNLKQSNGVYIKITLEKITSIVLSFLDGIPVIIIMIRNDSSPIYLEYGDENLSLLNGIFVNYLSKKKTKDKINHSNKPKDKL